MLLQLLLGRDVGAGASWFMVIVFVGIAGGAAIDREKGGIWLKRGLG